MYNNGKIDNQNFKGFVCKRADDNPTVNMNSNLYDQY